MSNQAATRALKGEAGLILAKSFEPHHLSHLGYTVDGEAHPDAVKNIPGTIYVTPARMAPVTVQDVVIKLDNGFVFSHQNRAYDFYTMIIPYTPPEGRRGTFYTSGDGPTEGEQCSFWIQQFPSFGSQYGRITVDILDSSLEHHRIIGVFKTDDNNYGASGKGTWERIVEN
ncbi:hypothetical protein V8B97DRAFT_2004567 [Scleroderma yunnanense]